MLDITYPPVIVTAKVLFKLMRQRVVVTGSESVPRKGGALLAINHTGYVDFIYAGAGAEPRKRLVRFMIKKEMMDAPGVGHLLRSFHHIRVDRASGVQSMKDALAYLEAGEVVGIYPEATISRSFEIKELKSGAARIATDAGVPLIPVIVWGAHRLMTKDHPRDFSRSPKTIVVKVGEPITPTGDVTADTATLRAAMQQMLDEVIADYPEDEKKPGSWWIPARFGGGAPTPEEADKLDREELRARAARRAAKAAEKKKS
ncbi:1-acyl-sn-glycerol-3-phosphate acyltransferase [Pimelobacter simplex]|uniref:1-acyl-sn-glycerol-3-phosphate acyltransferase n=1 Tax=Nocardioides simplex TaxID=2045 RepID=A0A0A1DVY8_NOCSI|nr:lysophospholipid acyltransferase family protein [Pimelobacter simplex]AIY19600.1 1-acyl-sn-glycerol-3-phosphate acyltransferase [Pimelobacter simplex]MCG8150707.1 1-acyl-sn-glycerol-3-phosphate acyltransferase [Pimelobacter simplex]GEB15230.1 1-acyl-sn-glycerol-3-phosphate acyltransferase [Pimelobacter simplex]SFM84846.1 1-acyl-sn-glycerol-3-phosphate acyltransferases [Pimelobacter simplex]